MRYRSAFAYNTAVMEAIDGPGDKMSQGTDDISSDASTDSSVTLPLGDDTPMLETLSTPSPPCESSWSEVHADDGAQATWPADREPKGKGVLTYGLLTPEPEGQDVATQGLGEEVAIALG